MCLAIPGKLLSVEPSDQALFSSGRVSFNGIIKQVNLCLVPEARVNDYVLVHVGVAISIIEEEEALLTIKYLEQMGELDELQTADT